MKVLGQYITDFNTKKPKFLVYQILDYKSFNENLLFSLPKKIEVRNIKDKRSTIIRDLKEEKITKSKIGVKEKTYSTAILLLILSYFVFGFVGFSYVGLVVGILLLDIGLQSVHVTNQTIIYSTLPDASNRLNALYMCAYFVGGAIGSSLGGMVWASSGWRGVVLLGGTFSILCLLIHLLLCNRKKYQLASK